MLNVSLLWDGEVLAYCTCYSVPNSRIDSGAFLGYSQPNMVINLTVAGILFHIPVC